MKLEVHALALPDIKIIRTKKHGDDRGYFSETYQKIDFSQAGIDLNFVQDNQSYSVQPGTIRGIHFQSPPFAQDKLVRVLRGRILDIAVDIRRSSPTFGRWVSAELSADQWNQILIPIGFAHAFCTLEPETEVMYKVTNYYAPQCDFGIRWDDPDLNIPWPFPGHRIVLSTKDRALPKFKDVGDWF